MYVWLFNPRMGYLFQMREEYAADYAQKRPDLIFFYAELDTAGVI